MKKNTPLVRYKKAKILQFSNHLSLLPVPRNKHRLEIAAKAGLAKESNDMKFVVRLGRKRNFVNPSQAGLLVHIKKRFLIASSLP
jgi:hypothetical protein